MKEGRINKIQLVKENFLHLSMLQEMLCLSSAQNQARWKFLEAECSLVMR